jgi:hypothetical protein
VELQLSELPGSAERFKSGPAAHPIFGGGQRKWQGLVLAECLA